MELLIRAQLTLESALLSPALQSDFKRMLELAPCLLEELPKVILKNLVFIAWNFSCKYFIINLNPRVFFFRSTKSLGGVS